MASTVASDTWAHCTLGELFRIKHGFAFRGEFFAKGGPYILLTPGNFNAEGGLKSRGESDKYYVGPVPPDYVLQRGDMLVVMTDLTQEAPILGSPAFIPEDHKYLHNQRLGKIVEWDSERIHLPYVYYLLNHGSLRAQIRASASGATVRHTSPERIYAVQTAIPPLAAQRKIAAILSAYDDLIANNTRRIALLEQMARGLYHEWFVRLRYPGHESARLVDSALGPIPEGWEVVRLGDAVELAYGKALTADARVQGDIPVYGSAGITGYHNESLVHGPGVIVGRKGNVGSVFWSDSSFFPIDTVYYVRTNVPLHYVYYNLQRQHFINNDAAVPGLNRQQAYSLPFLRPTPDVMSAFQDFVGPVFNEVKALREANANLRQTRDLLLPKLVSGAVDVAEIGIESETGGRE